MCIRDRAYVVAAAQWGQHNPKRETFGHSLIIDPWGAVVDELPSGDGVVVATLDADTLRRVRQQMPCRQHAALWPTPPTPGVG